MSKESCKLLLNSKLEVLKIFNPMVTILGKVAIPSYFWGFLENNSLAILSARVSLAHSQNQGNYFCVLKVTERIPLATNIISETTGSIITSFITKALSKWKAFSPQNLSQFTGYYENRCTIVFRFCVMAFWKVNRTGKFIPNLEHQNSQGPAYWCKDKCH